MLFLTKSMFLFLILDSVSVMKELLTIDVQSLITIVLIISVEVVGVSEFLKNFKHVCKGPGMAATSLFVTIVCSVFNTTLIPSIITTIFDIVVLSLAVTQTAYNILVKAIPSALSGLFDRALSPGNHISSNGDSPL